MRFAVADSIKPQTQAIEELKQFQKIRASRPHFADSERSKLYARRR
jgi:glutaredoxin-related protein